MNVLDDLRSLEERVIARMRELEPLIQEYKELEDLAKRLQIDPARATGTTRKSATPSRRTSTGRSARAGGARSGTRRKRSIARPGQRRDQVLAMVKQQPGVTVPDIAKSIGVDPTGLYRVVRALEQEGQIKKDGKALTPA